MINVGDRVSFTADFGEGTVMEVTECDCSENHGTMFFVDVDGYSNTSYAKMVNAFYGFNHGYVPYFETELNVLV